MDKKLSNKNNLMANNNAINLKLLSHAIDLKSIESNDYLP